VFADTEYISPRKNKWLIFFEARSKKEIGDFTRITTVCIYDSEHGRYAAMLTFMEGIMSLVSCQFDTI
jgi:hypothetical protein